MEIEEKTKEILWALRERGCIYRDGSFPCPPNLPDGSTDCVLCAWKICSQLFEEEKRELFGLIEDEEPNAFARLYPKLSRYLKGE